MSYKDRQPIVDIEVSGVPYTVFSGFCMGSADVVPGVSGGTMAVALGVYHQLLAAITSADRSALKTLVRFELRKLFGIVHWRFLASLLAGVLLGVALMVKVVKLPTMWWRAARIDRWSTRSSSGWCSRPRSSSGA